MNVAPARVTFSRTGRGTAQRLRQIELLSAALAAVAPAALAAAGAPQLALAALGGAGMVAVAAGALHAAREQPLERAPFTRVRGALHVEVDEQPEALRAAPRAPRAFVDQEPGGAAPAALVLTEIEVGGAIGGSLADERFSVDLVLADRVVRVDRFRRREDAEDLAAQLTGALSLGAHAARSVVDSGPLAGGRALFAVGAALAVGWTFVALVCVRTGTGALPPSFALAGALAGTLALAAEAVVALALVPSVARHARRVYGIERRGLWRDVLFAAAPVGIAAALLIAHARLALVPDGAPWSWGRAPCLVDIDGDGEADLVGVGAGNVVAMSGARGEVLWTSFATGATGFDLIAGDGLVIASTWSRSAEESWIRPIDPHTGAVAWTQRVDGTEDAAVALGGCVAARTRTHANYINRRWTAWDAASGQPCSRFSRDSSSLGDDLSDEAALEREAKRLEPAPIALALRRDEWAWEGAARSRPERGFEVSAQDRYGDLAWRVRLRGSPFGDRPLLLVDGVLVVVTTLDPGDELRVTGVDSHHGDQLWAHVYGARSDTREAPLIVPQRTRAVIGWAARLWALDGRTGRIAWVYGG